MKKIIKKSLIILLSIIALGSIYLYLTILAWQGLSAQDKLEVIEHTYQDCLGQGGQDCEQRIAERIEDYINTQKIEFIKIIQDKKMPEENRILALNMFFNFCRSNEEIPISPEVDFYYDLAVDQGNPFNLRQLAFFYSLQGDLDEARTKGLQEFIISEQEIHPDFRKRVIKNLSTDAVKGNKEELLGVLRNPDSNIRLEVVEVLGQKADQQWLPDLLEIAQEENYDSRGRALALLVIEDLIKRGEIDNYPELTTSIESLLSQEDSIIKLGAESLWATLTGEDYSRDINSEEIDNYITNVFLGNY